jgi:hypothetical protein
MMGLLTDGIIKNIKATINKIYVTLEMRSRLSEAIPPRPHTFNNVISKSAGITLFSLKSHTN